MPPIEPYPQPNPMISQMTIGPSFATLSPTQKLHAHHMAHAAWHSARIILEQVSPESPSIYDFILEVHRSCAGDYPRLAQTLDISETEITAFISYAATFLSNIGNYYGSGDQKFVPGISEGTFEKLAGVSVEAGSLRERIGTALLSEVPRGLGYPSEIAQSQYYPVGSRRLTEEQILAVSRVMERRKIWPENTRLRCVIDESGREVVEILQASVEVDNEPVVVTDDFEIEKGVKCQIRLRRGDFASILKKVCDELRQACPYVEGEKQRKILAKYIESFETGDLEAYRESQRRWVTDVTPRIESIFGFVETYRDPAGIRSEFEAIVAIANPEESRALQKLAECSDTFIERLPWAIGQTENNRKGPFEKSLFEPPSFTSIHTLTYCSSTLFDGLNLPNYNDIRDSHGFKNVVIANRLAANSNHEVLSTFVEEDVHDDLIRHSFEIGHLELIFHELLGHGTGKMMIEEPEGKLNFDSENPPADPLTGRPIQSWYRPGETWNCRFGDIATNVDECRCELVGYFLLGDHDLLDFFGYNKDSALPPDDLIYLSYVRLCALALMALKDYSPDSKKWGQAHSCANWAMLRCLLRDGNGCIQVFHDVERADLKVRVDRELVRTHGRHILQSMLLHLHMYRVTADIESCRPYFEELSSVDDEHLRWRDIVLQKHIPRMTHVHANTLIVNDQVVLKEYEPTELGIIQSWIDRNI